MDNPYKNPYSYPYHHGYPPHPPPNQDSYASPSPYQYPYAPPPYYAYPAPAYPAQTHHSHSASLDYAHSHAAPIPYQYPYPVSPNPIPHTSPTPTLQHQGSFQYGLSPYPYQQSSNGPYPPPESNSQVPSTYQQAAQYPPPESNSQLLSRDNSFSSHNRQESTSSLGSYADSTPSHASAYPPLDDLLSNVHLSDNHPTAPASPPAPSGPPLAPSSAATVRQSSVYGHANSFSSRWERPYLGRMDSFNHSAFSHSASFGASQHQGMQIVPFQKGSLRVLLLHGNLDIWVCDAKNLPNMDMFHKTLGDVFGKLPVNVTNKIEGSMNRKITSDPYVSIAIGSGSAVLGRTYVISNSENPVWMQHFYVPVAHYAAEVHFVVKDSDVVGSQLIGIVSIPVEQLYSGEKIEGIYPILHSNGKPCKPGAVLRLSIQ